MKLVVWACHPTSFSLSLKICQYRNLTLLYGPFRRKAAAKDLQKLQACTPSCCQHHDWWVTTLSNNSQGSSLNVPLDIFSWINILSASPLQVSVLSVVQRSTQHSVSFQSRYAVRPSMSLNLIPCTTGRQLWHEHRYLSATIPTCVLPASLTFMPSLPSNSTMSCQRLEETHINNSCCCFPSL